MFMGEYSHTIDDKGRFIVPIKFREALGEEFVLTRGLDRCLYIYAMDEWQKVVGDMEKQSAIDKNVRAYQRFTLSGAIVCEVDKQGRILAPSNLRTYAELDKEAVLVGVNNRIEIWSRDNLDASLSDISDNIDEITENIARNMQKN